MSNYSLVYVVLPAVAPTKPEINAFNEFTKNGGRIVLIEENNVWTIGENDILSDFAKRITKVN